MRLSLSVVVSALFLVFLPGSAATRADWRTPEPAIQQQALRHLRAALVGFQPEIAGQYKIQARLRQLREAKGDNKINDFDVTHTFIDFDADLAAGTIATRTEVTIQAKTDNLESGMFMATVLEEFSVTDAEGTELDYGVDILSGLITVTLPAPLANGQTATLVFTNNGAPDCNPDDYFGMCFCGISQEVTFFTGLDMAPAKAAFTYEDLMTSGAIDIDIHTPAGYVAVTTSDLDSVEEDGGELIHHFIGHFATTYTGLAYAPYQTYPASTANGAPVTTYLHTGDLSFGDDWAGIGAEIIDYYSSLFGAYLYQKHDIIQTVNELGGGVGPQSATFYYADALNTNPASWPAESIFSHEIGHQWWGNMIALGDGESPWLNEGFAEYSSRLYGYQVWEDYYQDYLYEVYFRYFQLFVDPADEVPLSGPNIFTDDPMAYQAITYWKGAHVLRMLQWHLGDDVFYEGMNQYANAYIWENSHELVTVDLFQQAMEQVSGRDLSSFFDTWVFSTGYPVYRYAAEFVQDGKGYSVRVRVEQTQETDCSYDLPLEISIYAGEQDEPLTFVYEFAPGEKILDVTIPVAQEPRGVKVDDRWWIWGDKVNELAGDVDSSNELDGIDLIYLAWSQGGDINSAANSYNYVFWADLNMDGKVDDADLQPFLAHFGEKGKINE